MGAGASAGSNGQLLPPNKNPAAIPIFTGLKALQAKLVEEGSWTEGDREEIEGLLAKARIFYDSQIEGAKRVQPQLEAKLAQIEQEYITRGGGVVVGEVEEPGSKGGDLDFIKHAARQQQVRELNGKMRYEWNRRTQEFGGKVTACSIQ